MLAAWANAALSAPGLSDTLAPPPAGLNDRAAGVRANAGLNSALGAARSLVDEMIWSSKTAIAETRNARVEEPTRHDLDSVHGDARGAVGACFGNDPGIGRAARNGQCHVQVGQGRHRRHLLEVAQGSEIPLKSVSGGGDKQVRGVGP